MQLSFLTTLILLTNKYKGKVIINLLINDLKTLILIVTKFQRDASNGLSYERMVYNIDKLHPRIATHDPISNKFCAKC